MDWTGGYSCEWHVSWVDPDTWADAGEVAGVTSVSIERDASTPLIETGDMSLDGEMGAWERWCRVSMVASQGAEREHVDVATLLFCSAEATAAYGTRTSSAEGWSVLKPCADLAMPLGSYAPRGCDGAARAAEILAEATPAPVTIEGSFELSQHMVFDIGCSHLDAAWALLDAGGWCIQIAGDGSIRVTPKPTEPALSLDMAHAALLSPGVSDSLDLSGIPNRYTAIDGLDVGVATNEDASSPVSYQARGRWVDATDASPALVNGESLERYAQRKLDEASTVARTRSYTREWWPGVLPFSVVRGSLPSVGLDGDMRVVSQSLSCGAGITVSETAEQEVSLL